MQYDSFYLLVKMLQGIILMLLWLIYLWK